MLLLGVSIVEKFVAEAAIVFAECLVQQLFLLLGLIFACLKE